MKTLYSLFVTALMLIAFACAADAGTIAVETFDYAAGDGALAGNSGGYGLAGSWTVSGSAYDIEDPVDKGWDDGTFGSPPLFPTDNMVSDDGNAGIASRDLAGGSYGATGETYWYAAMVFSTNQTGEANGIGIQLTDGTSEIVSMKRAGSNAWLSAGASSANGSSGLGTSNSERMRWLVMRIDYNTDTVGDVYMWVAPNFTDFTPADEPQIGDATLSLIDAPLSSFNTLQLDGGSQTNRVGQLRLATSWAAIPEPSTLVLLGLSGLLLLKRRRI